MFAPIISSNHSLTTSLSRCVGTNCAAIIFKMSYSEMAKQRNDKQYFESYLKVIAFAVSHGFDERARHSARGACSHILLFITAFVRLKVNVVRFSRI